MSDRAKLTDTASRDHERANLGDRASVDRAVARLRPRPSKAVGKQAYAIYVVHRRGGWIARGYVEESGEHVWSSEQAPSLDMALREVGDGIKRHRDLPLAPGRAGRESRS